MKNAIDIVMSVWNVAPQATMQQLDALQKTLGVTLPTDYREFMLWSDGGEGKVGSAYFSLWEVEKIVPRNTSASIWKYMSEKFIGIGTNGGDECYGYDYSKGGRDPEFAIVPMGDLGEDSKYIVAPTLAEAFQKAADFQFDDGEYNAVESGPLTQELLDIHQSNIKIKLQKLWEEKKYGEYVDLVEREKLKILPIEMKKVQLAKKILGRT